MTRPPILSGLAEIAGRYDGFILDLWGVVHDGVKPYPGVLETLGHIKDLGKRAVLLSNAPRRAEVLVGVMTNMGVERSFYSGVMSSGEATYLELAARSDPFFAALGRKLYHLGPDRDINVYEGLDYERMTKVSEADFILNTGPVEFEHSLADYEEVLQEAAARHLPMVCANPDKLVMRLGVPVVCAGALADRYRELGGEFVERGKPDPAIYPPCLELLGISDKSKVLAVGDALHTDIAGANAAGIDSLLTTCGIHAAELGTGWGEEPDPEKLENLYRQHGQRPVAVISTFRWS
jgi:HAD superfamily hydrolase (TIGR01459 family)